MNTGIGVENTFHPQIQKRLTNEKQVTSRMLASSVRLFMPANVGVLYYNTIEL